MPILYWHSYKQNSSGQNRYKYLPSQNLPSGGRRQIVSQWINKVHRGPVGDQC